MKLLKLNPRFNVISSSFFRDANRVPFMVDGVVTMDTQTLTANNTTAHVPIFTITGVVEIRGIWGEVTTVLGANQTAAYWRLNDATAQSNITVNTGTTISAAAVGSILVKKDVASAAVTLLTSAQERVSEPTTLETFYFSPFLVVAKNGVTTNIEWTYSTTDTPTSGVINFFVRWLPISSTANVTAL